MRLGALDFIEKPYKPELLRIAIDDAVASRLASKDARTAESDARSLIGALSRREKDVLQSVLNGQQNKVIAYELGLSVRTVEAYRAHLLTNLRNSVFAGPPGRFGWH